MAGADEQPPWLAVGLSLVLAILLQVYPLSGAAAYWRPDFLFLVMFYWLRQCPFSLGLGFAWLVGLVGDVAYGDIVGRTALAFCLSAYLLHLLQQRILHYRTVHEVWLLVPLLVISQTIVLTVNVILGRGIIWSTVFYTALTSALVWPMLKIVLSRLFPAHRVPA